MARRGNLKRGLWLAAALSAVCVFSAPVMRVPLNRALLFWLLVFLPQGIALAVQLREVHERRIAAAGGSAGRQLGRVPPKPLFSGFTPACAGSFALLKSQGINPNRAGPFMVTA